MHTDSETICVMSVGPKSTPSLVHLKLSITNPAVAVTERVHMRIGGKEATLQDGTMVGLQALLD